MFELGIFCVILLAIGYWAALWLMGRHDDVLHGDFVQTEQGPEPAATPSQPMSSQPRSPQPLRPGNAESLQSLLASIKRDLKDAAQI
ncbi:MAG: hypothetical protein WB420_19590 [Bradyrhizobium sp.]|jgi:hypothetical protein